MNVSFVEPRSELKPCIQSIWVFESSIGMPPSDVSLVAPNGSPKLIIQYENSIISTAEGHTQTTRESGLYVVGTRDVAVHLSTPPGTTGFIGIEFHPHGAYPLFGIPMTETINRLFPAETLCGRSGRDVSATLGRLETVGQRIAFVQDELVRCLKKSRLWNPLIEHCVDALKWSDGLIPIADLERSTGYSRRYLEMLFKQHVGFSPKVLAGIYRFQKFYRKWAGGSRFDAIKDELYDCYYDQAHFAKEFKRMTGYPPRRFTAEVTNEFGRRLSLH
ncbi:MAG TPA: helix-turn-helix domain-containing protein [Bacteroidota bacterium]|nr:helix-turn-helix domain-containing protein [Bacteroidota bacterium]